jgi:hypothetical protein
MSLGEIESALIKIRGVWVVIHIDPDHNWKAAGHDRYDDADRAAFAAGHWRYVNVTVTLHEHPSIAASVGTVEWGAMPTADIGLSHVINAHVPGLMSALRGKLVALLDTWEA